MCSASTPAAVGFARSIAHPPITNGWLVMTAFAAGASIPTSAFGAGIVTAADCAVHALVTVLSAYATTVYVPAARCDADIVNDAFPNRAPNAAAMSARYAPYGAAPRTVRPRDCVRRIPGQRALRRENSCRCAISISGCSVDEMPIGS